MAERRLINHAKSCPRHQCLARFHFGQIRLSLALQGFDKQRIQLFITNEILMEYEEVIARKWHPAVADSVVRTLLQLSNVNWMEVFFNFQLIEHDPNDNKFVD